MAKANQVNDPGDPVEIYIYRQERSRHHEPHVHAYYPRKGRRRPQMVILIRTLAYQIIGKWPRRMVQWVLKNVEENQDDYIEIYNERNH